MIYDSKETTVTSFLRIFRALCLLGLLGLLAYFIFSNTTKEDAPFPFKFGLDLAGGSHLVYEANVTGVESGQVSELMGVLRAVIETRVNRLGTVENAVYVEQSSIVSGEKRERLVVELPGVTDVKEAVAEIGRTPLLEFKLIDREKYEKQNELLLKAESDAASTTDANLLAAAIAGIGDPYITTGLTGRYLESSQLEFTQGGGGQVGNEPVVSIRFNPDGAELFATITRDNVGEALAIFLDGQMISAPLINEAIVGGTAIISGQFTADEARGLAENLNFGALPVPIELVSTQTIDATLGAGVLDQSLKAGIVGLALISVFMILWYRVSGLVASVALCFYGAVSLALFMFIPVTLTAAGLAGFVLSMGMAVDANVLIFERMKEEFRSGKGSREAAEEGFRRAWGAIKDSNVTGLLSAVILFWFGTALIKGFALVLGLGIIVSMLSAIVFTRTLLIALPDVKRSDAGLWPYLFGTGLVKK